MRTSLAARGLAGLAGHVEAVGWVGLAGLAALSGLVAVAVMATPAARTQSGSKVGFAPPEYVADEVTPPGVPRRVRVARLGDIGATGAASVTLRVRGGTATLGADFAFAADPGADHVVLSWAAGDTSTLTTEYRIVDDATDEGGEEIQFELTAPHGVDIDPAAARARAWIYDDDFPGAPVLTKARGHDLLYYLSLPKSGSPFGGSPVVFSIDGARGWYRGMEETFRTARGDRPFILVTPITLSNGAPWLARSEYYPADLDAGENRYAFDEAGLLAIWDDLRAAGLASDAKFYLTGHSGGGLLAYRMIFQHPNLLFAAAPTCPNFWASAIGQVSGDPARTTLRIKVFQGASDEYLQAYMEPQWQVAQRWLVDNGFRNAERVIVPGGHEPFADAVLAWFDEVAQDRRSMQRRCFLPIGQR